MSSLTLSWRYALALRKENSALREKENVIASKYRKIDSYFRPSTATIADCASNNTKRPHLTTAVIQGISSASAERQNFVLKKQKLRLVLQALKIMMVKAFPLSVDLLSYSAMGPYNVDFH